MWPSPIKTGTIGYITVFIGILFVTSVSGLLSDTESLWTHELSLESDVAVKWAANDNYFLTMEMSGPTTGYIGIGFSPNGDMAGSDIVIGWVDNQGMPHLKDYHAIEKGTPIEDLQQDYELIAAEEKDNRTTVRFRRRWETCDEKHDMKIGNDTIRLIWAWHPEDPEMTLGSSIQYKWHGASNRGVKSVYLRNPPRPKSFPDELQEPDPHVHHWDLVVNNIPVSNKPTTYICKIVRFPKRKKKHHMIGFRPIITEGNRENVHHMSVYHCQLPEQMAHLGGTQSIFDKFLNREPADCYGNSMPAEIVKHCFTFLFTWAVGSEGEMFPSHVGSPLGESEDSSYFKLEVHYDNPGRRTFLDSSGLRVFYTDEIRPYDATTLFLGHRTTPFQMIPYGQEKFYSYGFCSRQCTENGINPATGLSVMLHAHLSGRKIKLRHIRQGKELPPIAEDNHYDFNYQQFRILNSEVIIMPGDELLVECEYETLTRDKFVFGGPDAEQEMCHAILFYYPRSNLTDCRSQPEFYSFFKTLGVENVTGAILEKMKLPYDGHSMTPESNNLIPPDNAYQLLGSEGEGGGLENPFDLVRITKPESLSNYSVGDHMRQIRWNDKGQVRRIEKGWKTGPHYTFCAAPAQRRIYTKDHVLHYPKFREYRDGTKSSCRGRKKDKMASYYQGDHAHDHDHSEHGDENADGGSQLLKASSYLICFVSFVQISTTFIIFFNFF